MKSHPFDAVSMVFGVIFAGIGALFLMGNDVASRKEYLVKNSALFDRTVLDI